MRHRSNQRRTERSSPTRSPIVVEWWLNKIGDYGLRFVCLICFMILGRWLIQLRPQDHLAPVVQREPEPSREDALDMLFAAEVDEARRRTAQRPPGPFDDNPFERVNTYRLMRIVGTATADDVDRAAFRNAGHQQFRYEKEARDSLVRQFEALQPKGAPNGDRP